ncbi:MAG: hypothetical protein LBH44_07430 [Treponema sp.]|jgi:pyrroline-5-carboxylate reductase|nr:hypothetical protein [Treponema sp.]
MNKNIGIIGNKNKARFIFQTIINCKDIDYKKIFVSKDIVSDNRQYLETISKFDVENLTNQLFFYPEEYIFEWHIQKHPFFAELPYKIEMLDNINVFEDIKQIIKNADILFVLNNQDKLEEYLSVVENNDDFHLILMGNNMKFEEIEKIIPNIKVFICSLSITPLAQFVVKLCYNKNVTKNDHQIIDTILKTFGCVFDYKNNEDKYWNEILLI